MGYAGSIVALLIALPFLQAGVYGGAFLAAAALFAGFALPVLRQNPADGKWLISQL